MRECTAVPENDAMKGVRHGRRAGLSRVAGEAYVAKADLVAPASTAFEGADTAPHADDAACGGGGTAGGTAGGTTATMRIEQLEEAASVADSAASSACDPYGSDLRLCKGGCGFYGTKSRLWYCSQCRTHEEEEKAAENLEPTPSFKASHGRRSLC